MEGRPFFCEEDARQGEKPGKVRYVAIVANSGGRGIRALRFLIFPAMRLSQISGSSALFLISEETEALRGGLLIILLWSPRSGVWQPKWFRRAEVTGRNVQNK